MQTTFVPTKFLTLSQGHDLAKPLHHMTAIRLLHEFQHITIVQYRHNTAHESRILYSWRGSDKAAARSFYGLRKRLKFERHSEGS